MIVQTPVALGTLATRQAPRLTLEMLATSENTQSDHRTSPCDFRSPRSKRVHRALNRPSFEDLAGTPVVTPLILNPNL
jgi:hypothetical protein